MFQIQPIGKMVHSAHSLLYFNERKKVSIARNLPEDIARNIVSILSQDSGNISTLANLRLVNSNWREAVDHTTTRLAIDEKVPFSSLKRFKQLQCLSSFALAPQGAFRSRSPYGSSGSFLRNSHLNCLVHFHHLKDLYLDGHRHLTDQALKNLSKVKSLQSLTFNRCHKVKGGGIQHLSSLIQLKALSLTGLIQPLEMQNESFKALSTLPNLRVVNISPSELANLNLLSHYLSDKVRNLTAPFLKDRNHFSQLQNLRNLKKLSLCTGNFPKNAFVDLKYLTQLHSLDLLDTMAGTQGLSAIAHLTNLRSLEFHEPDVSHILGQMTHLERLTAVFNYSVPGNSQPIRLLKNLKSLALKSALFSEKFDWLSLKLLEDVKINNSFFSLEGVQSLKLLKYVKRLDLSHSIFPDGFQFHKLTTLEAVEELKCNCLKHCSSLGKMEAVAESIRWSLPSLVNLELKETDFDHEKLHTLSSLPKLARVDITGSQGLPVLETYLRYANPKLQIIPYDTSHLSLDGLRLTLETQVMLATMPNLVSVDLNGAYFSVKDYLQLRNRRPELQIFPLDVVDIIELEQKN